MLTITQRREIQTKEDNAKWREENLQAEKEIEYKIQQLKTAYLSIKLSISNFFKTIGEYLLYLIP